MLASLPVEILRIIITYIETARDLSSLSRTSQRLHRFVQGDEEGWRIFSAHRFPSLVSPHLNITRWRDAAHALSTLSRNLDRRAFIGSELQPRNVLFVMHGTRRERYSKPSRQTMGYRAVLDSYEEWPSGSSGWADRREVVAWGAGPDLIMRRTKHGTVARRSSNDRPGSSRDSEPHGPASEWWAYQERLYREGLHDIMTVDILRPSHRSSCALEESEDVLVGRANGDLDLIRIHADGRQVLRSYDTDGASVRSADISSPSANLIAAITGSQNLSLFPLHGPDEAATLPVSTNVDDTAPRWSTRFIGDTHVAVGRGPSNALLQVFSVTPSGLSDSPLRTLTAEQSPPFASTVYPITPLPTSTADSLSSATAVFLTGGYDGRIRLHDLRAPASVEATLTDPIDRTSIFSLLALGRERLVAGSAMNSLLKIFDLRMTGGRAYSYLPLANQPASPDQPAPSLDAQSQPTRWQQPGTHLHAAGFNVFAGARRTNRHGTLDAASARQLHSPVYSLSRPSPLSPTLYVGLEGAAHALDFSAASDEHPDPLFASQRRFAAAGSGRARALDPLATWWSDRASMLCMSLYEQCGSRNMRVLLQRPPLGLGEKRVGAVEGYDERLVDAYAERDRAPTASSSFGRGRGRGRR